MFHVPKASGQDQMRRWMATWLKTQLRKFAEPRITSWATRIGVQPTKWGIRPMKTKWGSCNSAKSIIWLNTELAKKPEHMIDYVIAHELAHLVSPCHDEQFTGVLDLHVPRWRRIRQELNELPLPAWTD